MSETHIQAFRAQKDFAPEAKLVVGESVWKSGVAGDRLYREVLAKKPSTVQAAIDKAAALAEPFTEKQVQGHLKWMFTAGRLEIDGKSFAVKAKAAKPKAEPKAAKPTKAETKVAATRQRQHRRTQRLKRRAA
jgi:hypothetical protein